MYTDKNRVTENIAIWNAGCFIHVSRVILIQRIRHRGYLDTGIERHTLRIQRTQGYGEYREYRKRTKR